MYCIILSSSVFFFFSPSSLFFCVLTVRVRIIQHTNDACSNVEMINGDQWHEPFTLDVFVSIKPLHLKTTSTAKLEICHQMCISNVGAILIVKHYYWQKNGYRIIGFRFDGRESTFLKEKNLSICFPQLVNKRKWKFCGKLAGNLKGYPGWVSWMLNLSWMSNFSQLAREKKRCCKCCPHSIALYVCLEFRTI